MVEVFVVVICVIVIKLEMLIMVRIVDLFSVVKLVIMLKEVITMDCNVLILRFKIMEMARNREVDISF